MNKKIGIIGFGNMGSAIAERLKKDFTVSVFDRDKKKTENLSRIGVSGNIKELVNNVDVVILAVKPQDLDSVLDEIKPDVNNKLIISIAAGIETRYIEKKLGKVRLIRVMPNLPAKISEGMSCLSKGKHTVVGDLKFAKGLFNRLGKTMILIEDMMNEDTAVSGSGPGFLYGTGPSSDLREIDKFANNVFIPSLSASAQSIGFTKYRADILAMETTTGSLDLLKKTKLSPAKLRKQVASKGGTTEAGLKILDKKKAKKHASNRKEYQKILIEAVKAALKRAKELSKKG